MGVWHMYKLKIAIYNLSLDSCMHTTSCIQLHHKSNHHDNNMVMGWSLTSTSHNQVLIWWLWCTCMYVACLSLYVHMPHTHCQSPEFPWPVLWSCNFTTIIISYIMQLYHNHHYRATLSQPSFIIIIGHPPPVYNNYYIQLWLLVL